MLYGCDGVQYGTLRGIMRRLSHLPHPIATFTSIHIALTLILGRGRGLRKEGRLGPWVRYGSVDMSGFLLISCFEMRISLLGSCCEMRTKFPLSIYGFEVRIKVFREREFLSFNLGLQE